MSRPFELIETMRWDEGVEMFDRHLARLCASAAFFGIDLDVDKVIHEVREAESQCEGSGIAWRLRLTVDIDGTPKVIQGPIGLLPNAPRRVAISPSRIDARNVYRRHKTSRRTLYDQEYSRARHRGWFEILYTNEDGYVAEGSRTNVFVELAGEMLPPPIADGALPGVFRSAILESSTTARVARITTADLVGSDRILVCNAVIGLVEVELIDSPAPQFDQKTSSQPPYHERGH